MNLYAARPRFDGALNIAGVLLAMLAAVLLAITGWLYWGLSKQVTNLSAGIREDALWAVYQLDRESRKLSEFLNQNRQGGDADEAAQLVLRYDIVWSRVELLTRTEYSRQLADVSAFEDSIARIADTVKSREVPIEQVRREKAFSEAMAVELGSLMREIVRQTEAVVRETNGAIATQRAERRQAVAAQAALTSRMLLALVAAVAALLLLLRRETQTSRKLTIEARAIASRLEQAVKAAEAGNRAKSSFVATVSHEIRTPLNAIIGLSEMLREQSLPQKALDHVDSIQRSGEILLEILNEVLDYSAIENGRLSIEHRAFDVSELVEQCAGLFRTQAERKGIAMVTRLHGATGRVMSDPTRLRQVLINLVGNAMKFTERGSVTIGAGLLRNQNGEMRLRLEVADTGRGIDPEGMPRLFKPFSQVDSSITRRYGGNGLGLSICKGIAEKLHGAVGAQSEPGRGSLFWIEVPVCEAPAAAEPAPSAAPAVRLPGLRILLVEDNPTNRMVASSQLTALGQSVAQACDGREAVEMAAVEKFDLIFMDMQMPVLSGPDAAREIRSGRGPNAGTPIVAMTANASPEDRAACIAAGMDEFESKPVRKKRLTEILAGIAAAGETRRQNAA